MKAPPLVTSYVRYGGESRSCRTRRFARYRVAVAVFSLLGVLALTHIPQSAVPEALQFRVFDKVEHAVAYGVVAGLFLLALRRPVRLVTAGMILTGLLAVGALDEVTQPLVNRVASGSDFVADAVGIALAGMAFAVWRRKAVSPVN